LGQSEIMTKRYLFNSVQEDLKEKMVFIGGPRQVGKTTLALSFLPSGSEREPAYLNWDNLEHRTKRPLCTKKVSNYI
jgi:uncharacterized protein